MKCPSNNTPQEYKNRNLIVTLEILDISERYSRNQSNLWYLFTVVILMNGGLTRVPVPSTLGIKAINIHPHDTFRPIAR